MTALPISNCRLPIGKSLRPAVENRLDVAMERESMDVNARDLGKSNRQLEVGNNLTGGSKCFKT